MLIKILGAIDFIGGLMLMFGVKFIPQFLLIIFGGIFLIKSLGVHVFWEKNLNMCVDVQFLKFLAFLLAKICLKGGQCHPITPPPLFASMMAAH